MPLAPQSISFKSKIKFIGPNRAEYLRVNSESKSVDPPYTEKQIVTFNNAYTDNIRTCTAGGITSNTNKGATLFHLVPDDDNINGFHKIQRVLNQQAEIKKGNKFGGLLIGGKCKKICDTLNLHKSRELFNKIRNFFEENNIEHSIIWGQRDAGGQTNIFYAGNEDTWYVSNEHLFDSMPLNTGVKILNEQFDIIKFSDKDKQDGIYIENIKIPKNKINKLEEDQERS